MNNTPDTHPLLFIITGSRGAGKTTFCTRIVAAAREAGWRPAGILSHPEFRGSQRIAIIAEDVRSGETRPLAARSTTPTEGIKYWQFDPDAMDWGGQVLASAVPCDLLIVDELGPLEFERGAGWQSGIAAVESKQYAIAIVVIRTEMLGEVLVRWPEANVVEIDTPEDSTRKASILSDQLF